VVRQFEGQNRVQTAELVDAYLYQNNLTQANTLFVANGTTMVDALAASPVINRMAAPLWLVGQGQSALPPNVLAFLTQEHISHIVLLGGPAAVAASIQQQLLALPGLEVERLGGLDRNATAVDIAEAFFTRPTGAVVAANGTNGSSFVDALSAGPLAAQADVPVLLTAPGQLPRASLSYLKALPSPQALWVMGGPAAVSSSVTAALRQHLGIQ